MDLEASPPVTHTGRKIDPWLRAKPVGGHEAFAKNGMGNDRISYPRAWSVTRVFRKLALRRSDYMCKGRRWPEISVVFMLRARVGTSLLFALEN